MAKKTAAAAKPKANGTKAAPKPSPASKAKAKAAPAPEPQSAEEEDDEEIEDDDDDEEDSDEEDDVTPEGLERLMKALGEDGLSDFDRAQLELLAGGGEDEDEDEEDSEGEGEDEEEGVESFDEEEEDDEQDDEQMDEDDAEEAETSAMLPKKSGTTLAESLAASGLIPEPETESEEEEEDDEDDEDEGENSQQMPGPNQSKSMYRKKINNVDALRRVTDEFALNPSSSASEKKPVMPWIEHMSVTYDKSIEEDLEGVDKAAEDDLKRELAFYKQALHGAMEGRKRVLAAGVAFQRPPDFFAEMVKSDEHMERVRQRLLDESAGIKASEEAKRQRELKKFGKKVQVEKTLERQKNKKDMEERIKGLKRKRQGGVEDMGAGGADDDFEIQLDAAIDGTGSASKRGGATASRGRGRGRGGSASRMPRSARDDKFGFGGKKRHAKENTKESTNDFDFGASKRGRGGARGRGGSRGGSGGRGGGAKRGAAARPGKARRVSGRK